MLINLHTPITFSFFVKKKLFRELSIEILELQKKYCLFDKNGTYPLDYIEAKIWLCFQSWRLFYLFPWFTTQTKLLTEDVFISLFQVRNVLPLVVLIFLILWFIHVLSLVGQQLFWPSIHYCQLKLGFIHLFLLVISRYLVTYSITVLNCTLIEFRKWNFLYLN